MRSAEPSGFRCEQCGNCCRVPGYVHVAPDEVDAMSGYLRLTAEAFTARYTRLTADRRGLSLIEKDGTTCIFLEDGRCRIQPVKPRQCKDFPEGWRFDRYQQICAGAASHRYGDRQQ